MRFRRIDHEDIKDQDPTPCGNAELWRFTQSLLDPNRFAFASFANQAPNYYTPATGDTNTLYHSQAGDLHNPGFSSGLGKPLSRPTSEGGLHGGQVAPATHLHGLSSNGLWSHHFQDGSPPRMQSRQFQSFAPHQFTQQPSAFDQGTIAQTYEDSLIENMVPELEMQERSPLIRCKPSPHKGNMAATVAPAPPSPNQKSTTLPALYSLYTDLPSFRYHIALNAPTAMIKQSHEAPVTYLNKGQAYSISLVNTAPMQASSPSAKYKTSFRVSFEHEQQRQQPASCWQLWKEGRRTNEAYRRDGRLQAVEFVDTSQVIGDKVQGRPRVELESSSFDGFVVTWTSVHDSSPECSFAVRFNFLSTDFSHFKGIKGIPVRLCAKTKMVLGATKSSPPKPDAELCYCKVRLFRDHGAERKLSNDVAHIEKTIDKLKQRIAQGETGVKGIGKREGSESISKSSISRRPGKVLKHKGTWSMSLASNNQGDRAPAERDLHMKVASLQDMFSSNKPISVLYFKGEEQDDPDLHPVLLGATPQDLSKLDINVDASV